MYAPKCKRSYNGWKCQNTTSTSFYSFSPKWRWRSLYINPSADPLTCPLRQSERELRSRGWNRVIKANRYIQLFQISLTQQFLYVHRTSVNCGIGQWMRAFHYPMWVKHVTCFKRCTSKQLQTVQRISFLRLNKYPYKRHFTFAMIYFCQRSWSFWKHSYKPFFHSSVNDLATLAVTS
jgi:hypothetical protein